MNPQKLDSAQFKPLVIPLLLFLLAAYIYSQYGFVGKLQRDDAMYLYAGQRLAEGVPPYMGIFVMKGPIIPMATAAGVVIADWLGWDDVYTVRLLFFFVSCLGVVAIYLLAQSLFHSQKVGVFAALTCLGFLYFAHSAASGPRAKTLIVFLGALALFLTGRKRWFWAAFCGALSALAWQPSGIFVLVTLLVAALQPRKERLRALIQSCVAIALPAVATIAYFVSEGVFSELLDGILLFHFRYMERPETSFIAHFTIPVISIFNGYRMMFVPIVIGLAMMFYLYFRRRSLHNSLKDMIAEDEFAPIALSFPLFVIWSTVDFQGRSDFFVFIPYAAVGFACFLDIAVERIEQYLEEDGYTWAARLATPALCIALIGSAWLEIRRNSESGYLEQLETAAMIERRFGKDVRLLSIGNPQILVIMHRVNPTRYVVVLEGLDRKIHAETPGGFGGWVRELDAYDPDLVAIRLTMGEHVHKLQRWLESEYHTEQIGVWGFYVKNSLQR